MSFKISDYVITKFEILIEDSLYFAIRVFGWMRMGGHKLDTKYQCSLLNVTFQSLLLI